MEGRSTFLLRSGGESMVIRFTDIQFMPPRGLGWVTEKMDLMVQLKCTTWRQHSVGGIAILQVTVPNQGPLCGFWCPQKKEYPDPGSRS